jgi:hypothetical protein
MKCGNSGEAATWFSECARMRARPVGPAESAVFHNFARRGPTKEAHRRALDRPDGLLRSVAGQGTARGRPARVGGRGWWQQRLDALPQPIGQELVGQDDHERSSSPITHPTSASWVAVGVRFAGRAALLRGCHPATSHTPSLKQHRCSRHRRTARPNITTRWSGRASGCTCTSAPAGTTRREARRRAAALYRCRPVAFAGLDPVAAATRRPPRPARPRGHNGRTRLGDATGGRASHEGVRL